MGIFLDHHSKTGKKDGELFSCHFYFSNISDLKNCDLYGLYYLMFNYCFFFLVFCFSCAFASQSCVISSPDFHGFSHLKLI